MDTVVALIESRLFDSELIHAYCRRSREIITKNLQKTPAVNALIAEVQEVFIHTVYSDEKLWDWCHSSLPKEVCENLISKITQRTAELSEMETLPFNIHYLIRKRMLEPPVPKDFVVG
jgi:hypothetical protein